MCEEYLYWWRNQHGGAEVTGKLWLEALSLRGSQFPEIYAVGWYLESAGTAHQSIVREAQNRPNLSKAQALSIRRVLDGLAAAA